MNRPANPEAQMAAALGGRGFNGARPAAAPASAKPVVVPVPPVPRAKVRQGAVHIGDTLEGDQVGIDLQKLVEGRLIIQGASGAGKSWTLRRLLEKTWGEIQQIVVDPEGEFKQLAEQLQLLYVDASKLDIATLGIVAGRVREHRTSIVLDISDQERDTQLESVTAFVRPLVEAPREHWHPVMVAIDEAHLFAPHGGYTENTAVRKQSIAAVTDMMSRGRKRGIASVLATQRFVRLAKSVTSEAHSFMIGLNTLDLDIARAADTIGWARAKAFDRLSVLQPGEFVAVGPAFSINSSIVRVGSVETQHLGATPKITAPAAMAPTAAARLLDLDSLLALSRADEKRRQDAGIAPGRRVVRQFLRDPAFPDSGRVWNALKKVAPEGALIKELAKHVNRKETDVAAALALLDQFNVLEFLGDDEQRAVRIVPEMLP